MARIVIVTFGSLGDLHPALALTRELQRRGHAVACATSEAYRAKIAALGVEFLPVRPAFDLSDTALIRRIMDGHAGSRFLLRDLVFPSVRDMHADLLPIARTADLIVASEIATAAPILGEQLGLRWAYLSLSPIALFPRHEPVVLPGAERSRLLPLLGPAGNRILYALARLASYHWWAPVRKLRRELGLSPGKSPLFSGKFSPHLNLAAFSRVLQAPQPDWPANTVQTGALFLDNGTRAGAPLPERVQDFLRTGPAPIVFTLGSAAVHLGETFYRESARAARLLGRRAVLLLGKNAAPADLPATILACDYAPYAALLPHAAAVVHQGGVGTTSETLRAGCPALIVPFAHDQFDNAARVVRFGAGRTLARRRYRAAHVARELAALLATPNYATRAKDAAELIARERGAVGAADALEQLLGTSRQMAPW